jgi:hypothetical protein
MPKHTYREQMTIANGTQDAVLEGREAARAFEQATDITILCPATLPETVTVLVAQREDPQASDYKTVTLAGTVTPVALGAGFAVPMPSTLVAEAMKLHAGAAV